MSLLRTDIEFALAARDDDDEGLFSRDINGQLVRLDTPTESDYDKKATLQIDGQSITVPVAEPLKDAQGNVITDIQGRTTPRYTTIFDAASRLYVKQPGDEAKIPIPVLCHQPHMRPVAVCRMCVVQIYGQKRGKRSPERKLLPACQHQVKDGMEVFTMEHTDADGNPSADALRVRRSVSVMAELLTADKLKDAPDPTVAAELAPFNELKRVADRCGASGPSRFKLDVLTPPPRWVARPAEPQAPAAALVAGSATTQTAAGTPNDHRPLDASSPVFVVDHSACILCDRCSRACNEVKQNKVIGRTGKGATAAISFDLDTPMGDSSCVQCGECMISCPTSAITFKPLRQVKIAPGENTVQPAGGVNGQPEVPSTATAEVVSAAELKADPLFAGVPFKFLLWQQGLVVRRRTQPGDVLCRQGDPGNKAFLIRRGNLEVVVYPPHDKTHNGGLRGLFGGAASELKPLVRFPRTPADLILGEMACLSGSPRTADIVATEAGEVWEVRRNVLDQLMRSPSQRERFEALYRANSLNTALRTTDLFRDLPADEFDVCLEFLRPKIKFVRVNPGQVIFRQGDWADAVYLVRLGHIEIGFGKSRLAGDVLYRGPGTVLGEIGLLALGAEEKNRTTEAVVQSLSATLAGLSPEQLSSAVPSSPRTATCTALDHVELARLSRADFLLMIQRFPTVRRRLVEMGLRRLKSGPGSNRSDSATMKDYVAQGLYQAQSLLVLDLDKCTRCDECVKACVDQHGTASHGTPISRLNRDGLRFGEYLVATACRSCKDAYCMIGCPVDAIHRGKHQQIVIEDHCIGCGLCASNCPYGNITMLPDLSRTHAITINGHAPAVAAPRKASTCDLCDAAGERDEPLPRCVYACPHDAAARMTGEQLRLQVVGPEDAP